MPKHNYQNMTLTDFVSRLGSKDPTPGGGGASALCAALGTALSSMTAQLTAGNDRYLSVRDEMEDVIRQTELLQGEFLEMVDLDADMFMPLSMAYSMPCSTSEEKSARDEVMQAAMQGACQIPLRIMEKVCQLLQCVRMSVELGSLGAVSDAGDAAVFCRAALEAAALNVFINTKYMKDRALAENYNQRVDEMLDECASFADSLYRGVSSRLRKKKDSARQLTGKEVADEINADLARRVESLKKQDIVPCLCVIRIGDNPGDISYEKGAKKRCEKVGIRFETVHLEADVSQDDLIAVIYRMNEDVSVHGVLLLRPLPAGFDEAKVVNSLIPEKDVDGMTDLSMSGLLCRRGSGFAPCTAEAVMSLLDYYGIDCARKRVALIGRSLVFGKPAALMLTDRNATVTVCHTKTENLSSVVWESDIVVASAGRARTVTAEMLHPGQVVIDVGINVVDGHLCGDVAYDDAEQIVDSITPVPGGVGAVTTSVLARHVVEACEKLTRFEE